MDGDLSPEKSSTTAKYTDKAAKMIKGKSMADITAVVANLLQENERVTQLSERDSLTGLLNDRGIEQSFDRLVNTLTREQKEMKDTGRLRDPDFLSFRGYTLLWIDMVGLKRLNDLEGWDKGNEKLAALGKVIKDSVHRSWDLAARLGGDDFLISLMNTGSIDAINVVKTLQDGLTSKIEVSIGIAEFSPSTSFQDARKITSDAVNEAKRLGKLDENFRSLGVGVFTIDTGQQVIKYG